MRGRRAKVLRHMAERLTVGKPAPVTRRIYRELKRRWKRRART